MHHKEKKRLLSDITKNSAANIFVKIMNFIQGVFVANILGPIMFGVKNAVSLIYEYGTNAHLGTISQHNIERNKNEEKNKKYANEISDATFSFLFFLSIFVIFVLGLIAYFVPYSLAIKFSIFVIGIAIVFTFFIYLYNSILTSQKNYNLLLKWNIINGIASIICVVPLTYFFKIFGFFLGLAMSQFISIIFISIYKNQIYKPKLKINLKLYSLLLKEGIFVLIIQLFWLLILSVDRIFVLKFFGAEILGYYAIGLFFSGYVRFIIQLISGPLIPRIYQKENVEKYIIYPNQILCSILYYVAIVSIILIPFVVLLFPKYGASTDYIKILVFSTIFVPDLAIQYFLSRNKKFFIIILSLLFLVLSAALNFASIKLGFSAIGIAFATLITLFLYGNTMNFFCYLHILKSWKKSIYKLFLYLRPLLYAGIGYLLIWGLFRFWLYNVINFYVARIIQFTLFTLWYLPVILNIINKTKFFKLLKRKNKESVIKYE